MFIKNTYNIFRHTKNQLYLKLFKSELITGLNLLIRFYLKTWDIIKELMNY